MGYRGKVAEREQARRLRAGGMAMADIAAELGVSKSSVSLWVREMRVDIERRAGGWWTAGHEHPQQRAKRMQIERLNEDGRRRLGDLGEQAFLAAGAALYAGEGGKTDGAVTFANCDPDKHDGHTTESVWQAVPGRAGPEHSSIKASARLPADRVLMLCDPSRGDGAGEGAAIVTDRLPGW